MNLGIFALAGRREGGPRGESGFAPEHLLLENDLHIGVFSGDFGQIVRHRFAEGALVIEELDEGHGGVRVADEQNAAVPNKLVPVRGNGAVILLLLGLLLLRQQDFKCLDDHLGVSH